MALEGYVVHRSWNLLSSGLSNNYVARYHHLVLPLEEHAVWRSSPRFHLEGDPQDKAIACVRTLKEDAVQEASQELGQLGGVRALSPIKIVVTSVLLATDAFPVAVEHRLNVLVQDVHEG